MKDIVIGRGRLQSERVFLRLERTGDCLKSLCRGDETGWLGLGHVEFPVDGPIKVGLHTIGTIDPAAYHGPHPDGTGIWFELFQLMR